MDGFPKKIGILAGAGIGAGLFCVLFGVSILLAPDFSYFAVKADEAQQAAIAAYGTHIVWFHFQMLTAAVIIGGLAGAVAGVLACHWVGRRGRLVRYSVTLGLLLVIQLLALADGIIRYPQLYCGTFFTPGAFTRPIMAFLTDHVPLWVPKTLLAALGLGAVLPWVIRGFRDGSRSVRIFLGAGLGAVVLLAGWGMLRAGSVSSRASDPARPNVLVIGIDSLRPDAIDGRVAPNIDRLASRGAFFTNGVVPLARTFPSWVSFLTSTTPNVHGVRNMFPRWEDRQLRVQTLPRLLSDAGWATAVIADYAGDIFPRIDLGFQETRAPKFTFPVLIEQRCLERQTFLLPFLTNRLGRALFPVQEEFAQNADPAYVVDAFRDFLDRTDPSRPFFATLFLSSSHFPYAAPYPFYSRFTDPDYDGPYKYYKPPIDGAGPPSPEDVAQVKALYLGGVAAADDAVGRILDILDRAGVADDTLVVVTADHGESLYDDGRFHMGHGDNLAGRQSYTIPLVIHVPRMGFPAIRNDSLVRSLDLAPTLLDLIGLPKPASFQGVSLRPLLDGSKTTLDLAAFVETGLWFVRIPGEPYADIRVEYPELQDLLEIDTEHDHEVVIRKEYVSLTNLAKYRMLQTDRFKLVYVPTRQGRVIWEFYDLTADPKSLGDLAASSPPEMEAMKQELFRWMLLEKGVMLRKEILIPE